MIAVPPECSSFEVNQFHVCTSIQRKAIDGYLIKVKGL